MHVAAIAGFHAIGSKFSRVGRPRDRVLLVGIPLGPVEAENGRLLCWVAGRPDRHVVVDDDRFPFLIRRQPRRRFVWPATLGLAACKISQRAAPGRPFDRKLDRLVIVNEREGIEGKRLRTDGTSDRRRQSGGQTRVIERRTLLACGDVERHELVTALYGPPIPELAGIVRPGCRAGDIQRQRFGIWPEDLWPARNRPVCPARRQPRARKSVRQSVSS